MDALKRGWVLLRYRRKTYGMAGRWAIGTLNQNLFTYSFAGGSAPNKPGLKRYFDQGSNDWRSFYLYNVEAYTPL